MPFILEKEQCYKTQRQPLGKHTFIYAHRYVRIRYVSEYWYGKKGYYENSDSLLPNTLEQANTKTIKSANV